MGELASRALEEQIDWDRIRERLAACGWSTETREAGKWAIDVLESELGPGWPEAWRGPGCAPPEIAASWWSLAGLMGTLDLALCLSSLASRPGLASVKKTIKRNSRADLLVSPRLQLKIACLAQAAGFEVELEPLLPGAETRADLLISGGGASIGVEALAVVRDQRSLGADEWLAPLTPELHRIGERYTVEFKGAIDAPLGEGETDEWLEEVERRASVVCRGADLPPFRKSGVLVEVNRAGESPGRSSFRMPVISFGKRLGGKLEKKAMQTRKSGATWLLVDSLDHLWHLTGWSRLRFEEKAAQLAAFLRERLADAEHLDGVVISEGAAMMRPEVAEATVDIGDHATALCRRADRWHVRESMVVPLRKAGFEAAQSWRKVLDVEREWLRRALMNVGISLPGDLV